MKRSELKEVLKPLIKECIKEAIFEDGVLSGIITEVMRGIQPQQTLSSSRNNTHLEEQRALEEEKAERTQLLTERHRIEKEKRRKLLDATGFGDVDVFSGTEALSNQGQMNENADAYSGPLSGIESGDAGVDISGIIAAGGSKKWKKLAGG